jgi:hypothetical protein
MQVYKHKISGVYLRLLILRESGINTFLEVDKFNNPIIKLRCWSFHKCEQRYILNGFKNIELTEIK